MNIAKIEKNLTEIVQNINPKSFIFDLLEAYGIPKATITLLKKGKRNLAKEDGQLILKRKLFFQEVTNQDLYSLIDSLKNDDITYRHEPRFIVVTDYENLLAIDTKNNDSLDISIGEINKHPFFFGPWAKIEKTLHANENPADVKAADKMAKIYDEILMDNLFETQEELHNLNVFLSRLLFCFFAEDTGIFEGKNVFTNFLSKSQSNGSDLDEYLNKLFKVLNTENRSLVPEYLADFPYVNGGLFGSEYFAPKFTGKSRRMIIECGELDWAAINPDIFGSMIQAVVHKDRRSGLGMHYTSVPNIKKVIEPLFLNELRDEYEKGQNSVKKLNKLLKRMENIRIFDPACGSGNFLIIAYKEIRELEMEIYQRIQKVTDNPLLPMSRIQLSQFFGIELDDFAHEVAILSLWLAEHQMNVKFKEIFGQANPTLPLKEGGNIICGNATRIPWERVCPFDKKTETFVLGNPPYLGSKDQEKSHKSDMEIVFYDQVGFRKLDYVSCWFKLGSRYIKNSKTKIAFVSTNSICQGEQVHILWPKIFQSNQSIEFAIQSFDWSNNAKGGAGVTCIIVGISSNTNIRKRMLFSETESKEVSNISPYLIEGTNLVVAPRKEPLSDLPTMIRGSAPTDGGNLILSAEDYANIDNPDHLKFVKKYMGAEDFISGIERYCLWITAENKDEALRIPFIKQRVDKCAEFRRNSRKKGTQRKASISWRFDEVKHEVGESLLFPVITSQRRNYIPVGVFNDSTVISNKGQVVYDQCEFAFGILSCRMHLLWLNITSSKMRNAGFQYSSQLSYNTFPISNMLGKQKDAIIELAFNILAEREKHPEKTIAELYDSDKMPDGLRYAHHLLDQAVENCYQSKPFTSDEERLKCLFNSYENMIESEKSEELL